MAHIEVWHRCPTCQRLYDKQKDAINCRNSHPIREEQWAVGKGGKSVKIFDNCSFDGYGGVNWALREADRSDFIEERKQQLQQD